MSDLFSHKLNITATKHPGELVKRRFMVFFLIILLGVITPFSLLIGFNYFTKSGPFLSLAAQRLVYLEQHPDRAHTLLFGSSRVNALDIQSAFSEPAYTYITFGGYTLNHLANIKKIINRGIIPQQILLGLGEATTQTPRKELRRDEPDDEVNQNNLQSLKRLVYLPSMENIARFSTQLARKAKGLNINHEELLETGRVYCRPCETEAQSRTLEEQQAVLNAYIKEFHRNRKKRGIRSKDEIASAEAKAIETIQKIIEFTDANNIELFIFLDPIYQEKYLGGDVHSWLNFKRKLSQLSPFLDFSNFDEAFAKPMNFNDIVHYNQILGMRLTNDIQLAIAGHPESLELGTWITAETVDDALEKQQQRYLDLRKVTMPQNRPLPEEDQNHRLNSGSPATRE